MKGNTMSDLTEDLRELHSTIREMTDEELVQLTQGVGMLYENGKIDLDKAVSVLGIVVSHTLERKIKSAAA
jgi:hypothetical protein